MTEKEGSREMATESEEQAPMEEASGRKPSEAEPAPRFITLELPATPATEWIEHATEQALIYQKTIQETVDGAIASSRSRLREILSTASAHSQFALDYARGAVSELGIYEDMAVGKVKEGVNVAASHPLITGGIVAGLGAVLLKRPRRFLYYSTLRRLVSEEAMLSQADARVKELRHSINILKAESEKLEKRALSAEEELIRGRTKLRQAGKQIRSAIQSAYKIERQAAGLKDVLRELPSREASKFQKQVSSVASEVKQEKNALAKEVAKISNYGISV